ncbi:signal peptidase I [Streptomyces durbertensis]|uniref:Signal peptidase I n=1 Tax=Streptomyces durbertensis TaxID=2448886 RepID=A0ABR6E9R6_9ACTN|nr:signal peptidase I [Streptomyces durbertensis]MBB1242088.1 signal peptidase I [Streptomyces durbertensis]
MENDQPRLPERDRDPAPDRGRDPRSRFVRTGVLAALLLLAYATFSGLVAQPYAVPTGSMENTLRPGDRLLVNKLAYRFGNDPARGDVVVFDGGDTFGATGRESDPLPRLLRSAGASVGLVPPAGSDYVKRVVGTGGDRVRCCDARGRIEVNGQPIEEPYLRPGPSGAPGRASSVPFDVVVRPGRLWVMGDHRDGSEDSRHFLGHPGGGTVPVERVIGRVETVLWPPGRAGGLEGPHG